MAKARAKFQNNRDGTSSVVTAFPGEATFGHLCKNGVRLLEQRCEVGAFEEAWRPDAFCGKCSEWGNIAPHCQAAAPRCSICAKDHQTIDHGRSVKGCKPGPRNGGGGPQTISFVERVRKERMRKERVRK